MTTTQKMILDAIVSELEKEGGTALLDPEWTNTGTISFVPQGSLTPHSKVHYNFQSTYWTMRVPGRCEHVASFFDHYIGKKMVEDEIAKVVDFLVA